MTSLSDAERIARRYPPRRSSKALVIVLALLLALVGGTWTIWSALYGANPPVSARVASFSITSDASADAVISIQRPDPSVVVECTVLAEAVSSQIVGQLPVRLEASDEKLVHLPVTVRTFDRATTIIVNGCAPVR